MPIEKKINFQFLKQKNMKFDENMYNYKGV